MQRSPERQSEALMPFGDHLEELRRRILYALAAPLPLMIGFFLVSDPLLVIVLGPVQEALSARGVDATLQVLSPPETLLAKMKLSIVAALIVSGPWMLWQAWLFVAPGLYRHERRFVHFLVPLSAGLSAIGVALLYWVMLPLMLQVLVMFTDRVQLPSPEASRLERQAIAILAEATEIPNRAAPPADPRPGEAWHLVPAGTTQVAVPLPVRRDARSPGDVPADAVRAGDPAAPSAGAGPAAGGTAAASERAAASVRIVDVPDLAPPRIAQPFRVAYVVNFVLALALGVAVAFQLPVVMLLAGWLDLVRVDWLRENRRYALLVCAIASAMATPADIVSMVLLLVPLYGLYELGILLLRVVPPSRVAGGVWRRQTGRAGGAASSAPRGPTDGEGADPPPAEADAGPDDPPVRPEGAHPPGLPEIRPADDAEPRRREGGDEEADEDGGRPS